MTFLEKWVLMEMDDAISWVEKFNPVGIDKIRHDKTTWLGPKTNDKWGGGAISWMRVGGSSKNIQME